MIDFNPEKLRSVYVNIVKVTGNYVYVTSARNGEDYTPKGSQRATYRGRDVTKVRIHPQVSHQYVANNMVREFTNPRLASLNIYDKDVVSIEIQAFNARTQAFQDAGNWRSGFSKVAPKLSEKLEAIVAKDERYTDGRAVFEPRFNGQEVFWTPPGSSDLSFFLQTVLDKSSDNPGSYLLRTVDYVSLPTMGISQHRKQNEKLIRQAERQGADLSSMDITFEEAQLKIKSGMVLVYRPDPSNPAMEAFSPVIAVDGQKLKGDSQDSEDKKQLRGLWNLCNKNNPSYVSLDFVLQSCRMIGRLYGHEATEFFDVPSILEKIDDVNITNIHPDSRASYPVDICAPSAVSWLMGFMHRETNVDNLRALNKMMRACLLNGIIQESSLNNLYKKDQSLADLPPMKSIKELEADAKKTNKARQHWLTRLREEMGLDTDGNLVLDSPAGNSTRAVNQIIRQYGDDAPADAALAEQDPVDESPETVVTATPERDPFARNDLGTQSTRDLNDASGFSF